MRFTASQIASIRRGKITLVLRPVRYTANDSTKERWMKAPGFQVGGIYAIERVDDVRVEREDGTHYERQVKALEEHVQIIRRELRELHRLDEAEVRYAGFDSLDDLICSFAADQGADWLRDPADYARWATARGRGRKVWLFEFCPTEDIDLFLAQQDGLRYPPQYTRNAGDAIDDAPVVHGIAELNDRVRARQRRKERQTVQSLLDACRTPEERLRTLHMLARERGIDVRSDIRALERRLLEKIGKAA